MKTYINKPFCIYVAIVFFVSIAVTIAIFANQDKSDKHDIVDVDGYLVDKFIYDVSKDIIDRVETLEMQVGVKNKKIEKAYNLELLYTADRTYIYRLRHEDKDLIFKYALYSPVTRNEVKIARELKHDNIVEIYSAFHTDDRKGYFVVTETMDCALSIDYSRKHPGEIKDIVRSVVHALKYLHDKNIVHCDIKLSNILVKAIDGKKVYKICDFGGAQYMYDKVINPVFYTLTDVYSAPETYFTRIFTKSTDIWCLGHTIWFYMQQRIMFVDQNGNFQVRLYEKYLKGDIRIDWATKNLDIVGRCCDRSPGKRATYDEILEWCNEE